MPRRRMRERALPHRAAYVFVFDGAGRLFVHRRTRTKDVYPGCHDVAAGGVVLEGETYEAAAARELAEELGIRGVALDRRFDFEHREAGNHVFGRVFTCVHDGPVVLQPEEVESGAFMEIPEVLAMAARGEPFTPDGLAALRRLLAEAGEGPGPGHDG
nr:NUDIX domain-containing protein [Dissulfurirhabdus thermomarina]